MNDLKLIEDAIRLAHIDHNQRLYRLGMEALQRVSDKDKKHKQAISDLAGSLDETINFYRPEGWHENDLSEPKKILTKHANLIKEAKDDQ